MSRLLQDSSTVALKEVKELTRDPVSLALTIMFPILLVTIFVAIVSSFNATSYDIPVVIADLDGSASSSRLLDGLTASPDIKVTQIFYDEGQAVRAVESGEAVGAIIIPKGFEETLMSGREAYIIVQTDNSKTLTPLLVYGAAITETRALTSNYGNQIQGVASLEVISRPISGRPLSGDPILPGMLGMITILGAFDDAVNAITRERERGTFSRLILTPVNIFSIYSGKMFATLLLNGARTTLMMIIFTLTGLVVRGNILLVYLTTSLMAMFTLAVGLALSSRVRSSSTLTILEIALTFPLFQLAGSFSSPEFLAPGGKAISKMLPWTYGNIALRKIIYLGLGLEAVSSHLLILSISTIILLPIATVLSKRTI
ncbi:MAG: ABC transporter permease [Candidatus Bathyarchaeia archaeon]